jgi:hypothetical protein
MEAELWVCLNRDCCNYCESCDGIKVPNEVPKCPKCGRDLVRVSEGILQRMKENKIREKELLDDLRNRNK